jgi:predicted AlkP superfamily pyrophosphatase or phosphodiesterase
MIKIILLSISLISTQVFAITQKPKLIVVISIDQFRTDYLQKYSSLFIPAQSGNKIGGFNYLMQKGAYFSHAEYGLLQNMTGPGHATILTGSFAYQNGIANNDWFDEETQKYVYCTEDQSKKTVGAIVNNPHVGTSPKNLNATTFGDELKNAYPNSKVVSVALKDRSSILMGGHRADIALWFDLQSFQWVSSEYYLPNKKLPSWLEAINSNLKKQVGSAIVWEKQLDKNTKLNPHVPASKYTEDMGANFPHKTKLGSLTSLLFPIGINMPVNVATQAIDEYKLGQTNNTDVLAISFSNHDYVGHQFGTESDEIKETTALEDKAISDLLNHINKKVPGGIENTWIVLTADHGVTDNPRILKANKIPAGILNQEIIAEEMEKHLTLKYGKSLYKWILEPSELNFFINKKAIKEKRLDLVKVQDELANYISSKKEILTGIAHIFSGADVKRRTLPPGQFEKQILRTYYTGRSGDVVMIQKPNFILAYGSTTHMSGYAYDRYVPIIFAGKPFKSGTFAGGEVVDIAPTLSFLMGIIPPTNSEGKILEKVLK